MKELEDFNWFPSVLRKFQLQYIGWLTVWLHLYKGLEHIINRQLLKHKCTHWIDLCTGSMLPTISIYNKTKQLIVLSVTDKFPINTKIEKLDVLDFIPKHHVYYTMFNSFHHFNINQKLAIIEQIKTKHTPFMFVEILRPNLLNVIKIAIITTMGQLILVPFIKPFSWTRLLFTYILPINIITVLYDGIISVCKSPSHKKLLEIAKQTSDALYQVNVITLPASVFGKLYLLKGNPIYE